MTITNPVFDAVQTLGSGHKFIWATDHDNNAKVLLNEAFTGVAEILLSGAPKEYTIYPRCEWWTIPATPCGDDCETAMRTAEVMYMMLMAGVADNKDSMDVAIKLHVGGNHGGNK